MKTSVAVLSLVVLAAAVTARKMDDGCSSVLYDMAGCMEYLTAGSNLTEPSDPECCIEFLTAMKTSPTCICDAVKYSNKIGLDISLNKANNLPSICHSHTQILCEDYEASWAPTPSMTPSDEAEAPSPNSSPDQKHKKHVEATAPAPAPAEEDQSGVNSAAINVSISVLCSLALLFANSFFILV